MEGFCSLASGSKGNATYIGTKETKLLLDVGISYKSLIARLKEISVDIHEIDGVVITHEHSDHIKGLDMLVKKHSIPVFANSETAKGICQNVKQRPRFKIFTTGEPFTFGDLEFHPFSIQHDTLDPVAFTVHYREIKLGICTDLGFATSLVKAHLTECDYLIIEANHEEDMVHACSRPMVYKQRVLGRQGHLSNKACGELLSTIYSDRLKRIFLAHLSSECNHPEVAVSTVKQVFAEAGQDIVLEVAHQDQVNALVPFEQTEQLVPIPEDKITLGSLDLPA